MKTTWTLKLTVVLFGLIAVPLSQAGLINININMTKDTVTGIGLDGDGILGGTVWNRIEIGDHAGPNSLVESDGSVTTVIQTAAGAPVGSPAPDNDNLVQSEAWVKLGTWTLTISGLLPNQIYKVAFYGARSVANSYTVNGVTKSFPAAAGPAATVLPGVESEDYVTLMVNSTAAGQLVVDVAGNVAGMQIEDVIDANESGPQMDCRIKSRSTGTGGKGNNIYGTSTTRSQSKRQQTTGRLAKRFYVNIENDGDEDDRCYAMAFRRRSQARVRVIDRDGGGNVTAEALAENYRYDLAKDDVRRFKVIVKSQTGRRGTIKVRLCGSPSTLSEAKQDCSTCVLKVRS